ncbi:MAG: hypothetical protein EPN30_08365 [Actinomycetota bacterium]|nr:MAG: hypothetical protein EPN30_08365 [Actinomycetota bacterium]
MKEVVAEVTVNPNTVIKAYLALEHDRLEEGRKDVVTHGRKYGCHGIRDPDSRHLGAETK